MKPLADRRKQFIISQVAARNATAAATAAAVIDVPAEADVKTDEGAKLMCAGGRTWRRAGWFERASKACNKRAECGEEGCHLV
jgi:hypothetical protein